MKVLFVLEHYHPYIGGAETLFQLLAESLAAQQHQVTVLTTRFSPTLPQQETHNGVDIVRINLPNRFLFTFFSLPKVISFARKADVIHTTTYNAALPAWLAAKICRRKIIVTFHEVWGQLWFRLPFAGTLERYLFYGFEKGLLQLPFDHYIAVSKFTEKALGTAGIPAQKIRQIYNGLHYDRFQSYPTKPPGRFTYTYFGRLGISKGLDLLLPAAQQFSQTCPDSELVLIIPKRPKKMYHQIQKMIQQFNLTKHIRIRHELSQKDLYEQICQSSCVVIPSYSEGFCFVAAETVALGVPIISSGKGALSEVVSGPHITMREMTAQGLYDALIQAQRGQWDQQPVQRFPMSAAILAYNQLYDELIKKPTKEATL